MASWGWEGCYFESGGYCLLNWHYNKLFEKLGELASILFGGLWGPIGLSSK